MPQCDWLIADDSLQQAGVGLAKEGRVGGGEKGGAGGGSKAFSHRMFAYVRCCCTTCRFAQKHTT